MKFQARVVNQRMSGVNDELLMISTLVFLANRLFMEHHLLLTLNDLTLICSN